MNALEKVYGELVTRGPMPRPSRPLLAWANAAEAGANRVVPWSSLMLTAMTRALTKGSVTVIAGPKSISKSFFVTQQLLYWTEQNIPYAAMFLEDTVEFYLGRALIQLTGTGWWTDPDYVAENIEEFRCAYARHVNTLDRLAERIRADDGVVQYFDVLNYVEDAVASGARIVVVDPITAVSVSENRHVLDQEFVMRLKEVVRDKASAILVTHPKADGTGLAGGEAFQRFSHCILRFEANFDEEEYCVRTEHGETKPAVPDRLVLVDKARNGPGTGSRIAMGLDRQRLTFFDMGVVVKA